MSEYTKNLISAIASGDAAATETSFQDAMGSKISAKLETMRQEVAQAMFKTEQVFEDELSDETVETTETE